jgi:hypothetical protein
MPIRVRKRFLGILVLSLATVARADVDRDAAKRAFDAFQRNCARDNGTLWGVSLCGPVVIVERSTRDAVDSDGWSGKLPETIGIANSAFDWNGKRASMVMWPLPSDDGARDRLLLHERFHAVQERIGLPMSPSIANAHLDTLEGRYLMRLEMRALRAALVATSRAGAHQAVADALAFHRARLLKFPNAAREETALDRNEGMAEFTGVALFVPPDDATMLDVAAKALVQAEQSASFLRSYAYATGPAWGLMLNQFAPGWQMKIASSSYEDLLAGIEPSGAGFAARRYNGAAVRAEETKRDEERKKRVASYRKRFLEGHVLTIPLHKMNMQFDPYDAQPFEGHGTVYEHITVSDDWGKIVVETGALISSDFKTLTVYTSPADAIDAKPPWAITLAPGWRVAAGARPGDQVVTFAR